MVKIAYIPERQVEIYSDLVYQNASLIIPGLNMIDDLETAFLGKDIGGIYKDDGEIQDARFSTILNVGTLGIDGFLADIAEDSKVIDSALTKGGKEYKGEDNPVATGARNISVDEYFKLEAKAESMYNTIRNSTDDVSLIAKNTGMLEWQVQRIKDHVFNNEHILSDGVKQFYPDYDIAQAWNRLKDGSYVQNDIDLINHELFESKFEGIFKTDYQTAHGATISSGRTWDPDK